MNQYASSGGWTPPPGPGEPDPAASYYAPVVAASWPPRLRPVRGLASVLRWLLGGGAVVVAIQAVLQYQAQHDALGFLVPGQRAESSSYSGVSSANSLAILTSLLAFGLMVAIFVVLIVWLYRVTANNEILNGRSTWVPGWAIGAWFIPVAFYVLPYLVINDQFRKTRDHALPGDRAAFELWWWAWVGGNIASVLSGFTVLIIGFDTALAVDLVARLVMALSGVFAIMTVTALTRRQHSLAAARGVAL